MTKFKHRGVSYAKWGCLFILPFFANFLVSSLIPLADTIRYSFFEHYRSGIREIGPNPIGMQNYLSLLRSNMLKYTGNTMIIWLIGFIPRIVITLTFASWFMDACLKTCGQQFFKVIIYLPNLVMALTFTMLFFTMFSINRSISSALMSMGIIHERIDSMGSVLGTRSLVGLVNFLMWFGNSTVILMVAIMGTSPDIFETSGLDGCNSRQKFFRTALPLTHPILAYTLTASIVGGLQMFDVPQILTNGRGTPDRTPMTLAMFLNNHLKSGNYGIVGTLSVYSFIVSGIFRFVVYRMTNEDDPDGSRRAAKKAKGAEK